MSEEVVFEVIKGIAYKPCSKCKKLVILTEFHRSSFQRCGFYPSCKKCRAMMGNRANRDNDKYKYENWKRNIKKAFGLSPEQYYQILYAQNGVCAICKQHETKMRNGSLMRLSVDHDYKTGKIRGLLCGRCNNVLSRVGENLSILQNTIKYIMEYS